MKRFVYIGTYTQQNPGQRGEEHRAKGIFVYRFDSVSGRLEPVAEVEGGPNPGFLAVHPNGRFLYAGNELEESAVSAFALDPNSAALNFLNRQPTQGMDTCYLSLDPQGQWLMTANYSSGTYTVLPVQPDGRLRPLTDLTGHQGAGPNPDRQEGPHAHSIRYDPSGQWILAADLGLDHVWVYRLDKAAGRLVPNDPAGAQTKPGAGPRHLAFHPNGRVVYVANEIDSTVAVFDWDARPGVLTLRQSLPTLPGDFKGYSKVADIHLTPSGRWLYVSNRGHNSLAAFSVDPSSGGLEPAGYYSSQGETPRNFAIDPNGTFLLVANQDSDTVYVERIEETTGRLEPTGEVLSIPRPVCVIFYP